MRQLVHHPILARTKKGHGGFDVVQALAKNDRGDHVRTEQGYTRLAKRHFERVDGRVVGDSLTCPSAGWLMTLTAPRRAA